MDRIKSQRQEWMSKSMQEVPEGAGTMDTKPNQSSPGKSIGIFFLHASHLNEVIKALFISKIFCCMNKWWRFWYEYLCNLDTNDCFISLNDFVVAPTLSEYSLSEQGSPGIENVEPVKVTQPAKLARQPLKQHSQGQPGQRELVKKVKVKNCAHNLQLYCFHLHW